MKFYTVIDNGSGYLAIMPHPSSGKALHSDIEYLAKSGIDTVISLLTDIEEKELNLSNEKAVVVKHGMDFRSFSILDKRVPHDLPAFCELASDILHLMEKEHRVIVHCWAGIGRSGLLASAVLVLMGHDPKTVFDLVTTARGKPIPETQEQTSWFVYKVLPYLSNLIR